MRSKLRQTIGACIDRLVETDSRENSPFREGVEKIINDLKALDDAVFEFEMNLNAFRMCSKGRKESLD